MTEFFAETEPIRRWLYGLAIPVLALLVLKGVLTKEEAAYYLAIAGAALVMSGGVEMARTRTTSLADPRDNDGTPLTRQS